MQLSDPRVCKRGLLNFDVLFCLIYRVLSRIAVIPFARIDVEQSLENSLSLQMELKPLLEMAVRSIPIILNLADAFTTMTTDPVFQELLAMSESVHGLDHGAKSNFVLLMYSTGKVCSPIPLY